MARVVVVAANARSLVVNRAPLIEGWKERGHEVIALIPEADASPSWLERMPVPYHLIPLRRLSLNPVADMQFLVRLVGQFRELDPDVVFGYALKPIIYGSIAARIAGVPRVYSLVTGLGYSFSKQSLRQRLFGTVALAMYRAAGSLNTRMFFQNDDDLQQFIKDGVLPSPDHGIRVFGSGVPLNEFPVAPLPGPGTSFLLMARLMNDKGIVEFVESARRLRPRYPGATFRVLGAHDESLPGALPKAQLAEWQEEGVVEFGGYVMDVRPHLARTSVYVLPTRYREGVPRSILEAMSVGRAIVTTDSPGCRDTVVDGKNGFLVPVGDIDALEHALERFLIDPELAIRFGAASRQLAEERFDANKVSLEMLEGMGMLEEL